MLKISKLSFFVLSSFLLTPLASISCTQIVNAVQNETETLTVVVSNIQHQKGQICIGVYSRPQGFPSSPSGLAQSTCEKITGNTLKHKFSGLKPGTYAVAVVDDQNGDRKLNKDFLGIPKEGFGISNNPTVSVQTGEPDFSQASFPLNRNTTINIKIKYSLDR